MQVKEATEPARMLSWEPSHAGNMLCGNRPKPPTLDFSTASVTFSPPHTPRGTGFAALAPSLQILDFSIASNLQRGMGPSSGASPLGHFRSHFPWQNTLICRHVSRNCKVLCLDSSVVTQHTAWRACPSIFSC